MPMRAAYATNVSPETLKGVIRRLSESGVKVETSCFDNNVFIIGSGDHKFIAGVVGNTVYVNKLGTLMVRLLEKNNITYSFTQHVKIPLEDVENIIVAEECAV